MVKEAAEEVGVSDVVPEMVERVARAIMANLNEGNPVQMPYEEFSPLMRERFHKVALAAIEAMRMTYGAGDAPDIIHAKRVWNAGIDAALSPPDGQKR